MASTCLMTGGAGFIGCALSAWLAKEFDRVVVVDNLHPQIHARPQRPVTLDSKCEIINGDITAFSVWETVLNQCSPDIVVHLAAETGTGQSLSEATRHGQTNVVGMTAMLDAMFRHRVLPKRIVLASSRAVYGEGAWLSTHGHLYYPGQRGSAQLARGAWDFDGVPLAMDARKVKPAPVSVYGATKLAQENILSAWANAVGCEYVVLRLQNVFGPGQSLINSYTGIVSLFCQIARRKEVIPLYEDGLVRRDFVLIDDVASAFIRAITAKNISGEIFDIGSGFVTTLRQLGDAIAEIYRAPQPRITGKFRFGDVRHAFTDTSFAQSQLDWRPQVDLRAGLISLTRWIEAQT